MYLPKYQITNTILKNVSLIEAAREVVENAALVPAWEAKFRRDAVIRTVHYGTHLEGNPLSKEQVERVVEEEELLPKAKGQGPRESESASPLALSPYPLALPALAGLLFLVHPLNSQAVAYVAQRFTSVATMFYLLTIIFYILYNNYKNYSGYLSRPETAANAMVTLINQTNRLLDQKLRWLEEEFVKKAGFREHLLKKRLAYRNRQ